MSLSLDYAKKGLFLPCKIIKMKTETLVLAFLPQTLLFTVEIRAGGLISTQTRVIADNCPTCDIKQPMKSRENYIINN